MQARRIVDILKVRFNGIQSGGKRLMLSAIRSRSLDPLLGPVHRPINIAASWGIILSLGLEKSEEV